MQPHFIIAVVSLALSHLGSAAPRMGPGPLYPTYAWNNAHRLPKPVTSTATNFQTVVANTLPNHTQLPVLQEQAGALRARGTLPAESLLTRNTLPGVVQYAMDQTLTRAHNEVGWRPTSYYRKENDQDVEFYLSHVWATEWAELGDAERTAISKVMLLPYIFPNFMPRGHTRCYPLPNDASCKEYSILDLAREQYMPGKPKHHDTLATEQGQISLMDALQCVILKRHKHFEGGYISGVPFRKIWTELDNIMHRGMASSNNLWKKPDYTTCSWQDE